jgi:hypothetical protein
MKREVRILLSKSTDSVLLAIEHFNRPWDRGRHEAVLVLLDHAFELLLKAIIVHKGGRIREPRAKETIGFNACVRKCVSDAQSKCLTEEEALTVQIINSLRDAAQHYVVEVSEQQLYIYTQSGLTLFNELLQRAFSRRLYDYLPERVLPVSSNPPRDFCSLIDVEFEDIKKLVTPGSRRRFNAKAKLRSFAILEASLGGSRLQPGENELSRLVVRVGRGERWQQIFPGIAQLALSTETDGFNVKLTIIKAGGEPVYLVPEGTPGATVVAVKRVDELGYYSLNLTNLAQRVNLSQPKTLAVIKELELQKDPEYFKEISINCSHFKRYSAKSLAKIKEELPNLDIHEIWNKHKPSHKKSSNKG